MGNESATEFLANVRHGIRTPLNAIIGMTDVLAETGLTPDQRECVEVIQRNGVRLLDVLSEVLQLAGAQKEDHGPVTTAFLLNALIRQAAPIAEPVLELDRVMPNDEMERAISGLRILLAEDSEDNRYLIQTYLKKSHVSISMAVNGALAVEAFEQGEYDIVLMDVEMPVLDGLKAATKIRQLESDRGVTPVPMLALTAHVISELEERPEKAHFTAFLSKPIRKVTLLQALYQWKPDMVPLAMDPDLRDVLPGYLDKRRGDVKLYREALERRDFETIRKLAHKMRGTGAGYGIPAFTDFGGELEMAAAAGDEMRVRESLNRFAVYAAKLRLQ